MNKKFLSFALVFIISAVPLIVSAETQPTIAVLGTTEELSDLCTLVEAGLFQKGTALVERAKIDKILQEQKLTAAGIVERDNLLKLGQLIRADGFLLISVEKNSEAEENPSQEALPLLRIRLVDTAHGLRFLDTFEEWDNTKLKETTERITENVSEITPKLILPPDKAIPIGIVGIHRVELDKRYNWLTRTLPVMLSARLNKEPRIIMLEREDLKKLLDEKLLTQGEDTDFWTSAILIDGYIQREGKKEIKLQLQMKNFSGKEVAVFSEFINPDEPLPLVDKITNDIILKLLNTSSVLTVWDSQKEAEEFFREGDLLRKHVRYKDAIEPLETAYALQPDNVTYTGALFENEWGVRFKEEWTMENAYANRAATGVSCYSDLELAYIVSRLIRQIKAQYGKGLLSVNEIFSLNELIGRGAFGHLNQGYLVNSASISTQEVRDINHENRKIWVEFMKEIIKVNPKNWISDYSSIDIACVSSDNPDELINNIRRVITELCMPPEEGGRIQSFDQRFRMCNYAISSYYFVIDNSHLKGQGKKFLKLLEVYLGELARVKDPLVRFHSCMALSARKGGGNKEAKDYCLKAIDILLNELKSPNEPFEDKSHKFKIRNDIRLCISFAGFTPAEEISIYEKLYYPLIENKDCANLSHWWGLWNGMPFLYCKSPEIAKRYIKLLEDMAKVMKNCNELDIWSTIIDWIALTRNKFPQLEKKKLSISSIPVKMLLDVGIWPKEMRFKYLKSMLQDDMLWVAFAEHYEKPIIGLAGIDLERKKLISLWEVDFGEEAKVQKELRIPVVHFSMSQSGIITGIAVNGNKSYVAIREMGLIEFPGSSIISTKLIENPKILTEKDGLPSISITGMASDGDKLWIAYGGYGKESGLGIYTPKTKNWEIIFCSTVKGNTPFSAGNPYAISNLTFSPKRDKLFFIVGEDIDSHHELNKFNEWTKLWGLWKIDINTKETTFLWNREEDRRYLPNIRQIINSGDKWWLKLGNSLIEFDPNSEKAKFILGLEYRLGKKEPKPEIEIDCSFSSKNISFPDGFETFTIHNDRLWGRLGLTQLITIHKDDKNVESFNNNILKSYPLKSYPVGEFLSTPYGLIAVGWGLVGLIETEDIDTPTKNE